MKKTTDKRISTVRRYWPIMTILLTLSFSILQARDSATDNPHAHAKKNGLNNSGKPGSGNFNSWLRETDKRFVSFPKFGTMARYTKKTDFAPKGNRIIQAEPITHTRLSMPGLDELANADQGISINYEWDQLTESILPNMLATHNADEAINQEFEKSHGL